MKYKKFILIIRTEILMTSCGSIFTGTKDTIMFNSTPENAKLYIDGFEVCNTPCTIHVFYLLDLTKIQ